MGRPRNRLWLVALALAALGPLVAAGLVASARAPAANAGDARSTQPGSGEQRSALAAYANLPARFVPNAGQLQTSGVGYTAQGAGYRFSFSTKQVVLSFVKQDMGAVLALRFLSASPDVKLEAHEKLAGKVNYFLGHDPAKWRSGLPTYRALVYRGLWPGIDLQVRGEPGRLKYEFHVRPGADPSRIRLAYRGARRLSLSKTGALAIVTPLGTLTDARPRSYQPAGGKRLAVESAYVLRGERGYGFALAHYEARHPLVIDPGLEYSTYLGGSDFESGGGIAVEGGAAYISGCTFSSDFPTTPGAFQTGHHGGGEEPFDAFVTKLAKDGSALLYSTYLGGSAVDCVGNGLAVKGGRAYIVGATFSNDFPTTPDAFQLVNAGGGDGFVTQLAQSGSALVYSTYLGGVGFEQGTDIAVEGERAYVTGITDSNDFPTTPGAFQPANAAGELDVFATQIAKSGSGLAYSTYLGGSDEEESDGIAVEDGHAYVTGFTRSSDFPTTPGAFQPMIAGGADAFVTKLEEDGSALAYSTYVGGSNSEGGRSIAVEGGRAYVTGSTRSLDFPTTPGAVQPVFAGGVRDAFVTKLEKSGAALAYSTYLGGSETDVEFGNFDFGNGIAVAGGRAYVTGNTDSTDFPTTPGAFQTAKAGFFDAFVTKLARDGSMLAYSTYLGSSDDDEGARIAVEGDRVYVGGGTSGADFPTTPDAFQPAYQGGFRDAFVTKLDTK